MRPASRCISLQVAPASLAWRIALSRSAMWRLRSASIRSSSPAWARTRRNAAAFWTAITPDTLPGEVAVRRNAHCPAMSICAGCAPRNALAGAACRPSGGPARTPDVRRASLFIACLPAPVRLVRPRTCGMMRAAQSRFRAPVDVRRTRRALPLPRCWCAYLRTVTSPADIITLATPPGRVVSIRGELVRRCLLGTGPDRPAARGPAQGSTRLQQPRQHGLQQLLQHACSAGACRTPMRASHDLGKRR